MTSILGTLYRKNLRCINKVRNAFQNRALIILYHRVAEIRPDVQRLCTTPSNFEAHLKEITQNYQPISLHILKENIGSGTIPRNAVVVTFDDGYIDNLRYAAPLLEKYGVPATIFVTTGFVDHSTEMVSDALERVLLSPKKLPKTLTLKCGDKTYQWILGDASPQSIQWDVTSGIDPSPHHGCYRDLHRLLRPMSASQRQEVLKQLYDWAGFIKEGPPDRRIMNSQEIRAISRSGLIEIGAHSVSHVMLAKQAPDLQRREILGSKEELETILGSPVTSFAYPYGGCDAVDNQTIKIVQDAGFDLACDNVPGTVGSNIGLHTLPRFLVRDWDSNMFHKQIKNAFLD